MNILHILSSDDKYGSAQCFRELLSAEVNREDIYPVVVTPKNNDITRFCDVLGVKNYVVDYGQFQIPKHDNALTFAAKFLYHTFFYYEKRNRAQNQISTIIQKENIQLIHTNSCVIDIGARSAKACNIANIWHLREFGKQDFNFCSANPFFIKEMNGRQNRFISISNVVTKTWIERGINKENIKTIYDGVDAQRFSGTKIKCDDGKIRFVMCGSFCNAKGQKLLVEAVSQLSPSERENICVDLYGKAEGAYYEETLDMVHRLKLDNLISFKGYAENIPELLARYDVGILCSKAEAFGRVTAEYMLAGLCTVAPLSGANPEIIADGCGVLYPVGDISSLTRAMREMIEGRIDYIEIGKKARREAVERFDINKNANKIIEYFLQNAK